MLFVHPRGGTSCPWPRPSSLVRTCFAALAVSAAYLEAHTAWYPRASVPGILDCTYDEDWRSFQTLLQDNALRGYPFEAEVFDRADGLIAKNLLTFLEFHRSKSNEFFYDCDRVQPHGMVCLYGMLSALVIHHTYLRRKIDAGEEEPHDRGVFGHSTNVARFMLINKNNCLDFFDASGWPFTLMQLLQVFRPTELTTDGFEVVDGGPELESWPGSGHGWLGQMPWAKPLPNRDQGCSLVVHISGTHAALAREPAEMLRRFAGPMIGCSVRPVLEVVDEFHCQFLGAGACGSAASSAEVALGVPTGTGSFELVGLSELAAQHFQARWNGMDILDLPGLQTAFERRFRQSRLNNAVDLFVCTTPAVLCTLLLGLDRPLLAYLGEPLLLSVAAEDRAAWWQRFEDMVRHPNHRFMCYNPFLSHMVRYQTGLALPVIRLHGLYTDAMYSPTLLDQVLVIKGPNICLDPVCLLNRFVVLATTGSEDSYVPTEKRRSDDGASPLRMPFDFIGLDELGGAPYRELASFRATVLYPYDVALAIFYELYSMCMPMFVPHVDLLPFYVFRGLHSHAEYHDVRPGAADEAGVRIDDAGNLTGVAAPGAGLGFAPFIAPMGVTQWFRAGRHWSEITDFHRYPNLLRFSSVAEMLRMLEPGGTDWASVSASMRRFNEETLVESSAHWAQVLAGALLGHAVD